MNTFIRMYLYLDFTLGIYCRYINKRLIFIWAYLMLLLYDVQITILFFSIISNPSFMASIVIAFQVIGFFRCESNLAYNLSLYYLPPHMQTKNFIWLSGWSRRVIEEPLNRFMLISSMNTFVTRQTNYTISSNKWTKKHKLCIDQNLKPWNEKPLW